METEPVMGKGASDRARIVTRPTLRYLETHLVDHCNLNCKGCGHFSPLASATEETVANVEGFTRDMARLAELFDGISRIHLLGGEPFLHPRVGEFVQAARRAFPASLIGIVSNGILLPSIGDDLWHLLKVNDIFLRLSVYPLRRGTESQRVEQYAALATERGISVEVKRVTDFGASMNLDGSSVPSLAMKACRSEYYCPNLADGRIYLCPMSAYVKHFNAAYDRHIPADGFIDIHHADVTGDTILDRLEQPAEVCRYCSYGVRMFPWAHGTTGPDDWSVRDRHEETDSSGMRDASV